MIKKTVTLVGAVTSGLNGIKYVTGYLDSRSGYPVALFLERSLLTKDETVNVASAIETLSSVPYRAAVTVYIPGMGPGIPDATFSVTDVTSFVNIDRNLWLELDEPGKPALCAGDLVSKIKAIAEPADPICVSGMAADNERFNAYVDKIYTVNNNEDDVPVDLFVVITLVM